MNRDRLRIAVRKFGPFETAMENVWQRYREWSGCDMAAEFVPLDLHPLYAALMTDGGLRNGDWDVAHISTDWIREAHVTGAVADLAPFIENHPPDNFPGGWSASLLGLQTFGKQIAGLPFHDGPECLIVRKDLFEDETERRRFLAEYGRPLAPPVTWQEFTEVSRFFNRPEQGLYGTVFAGFPDGHNTVFDFCLQVWSRGGVIEDASGRVRIDTPEAEKGLLLYRQLLNDPDIAHPGSPGFGSVEAGAAFARGEVAMMINWFGFASVCEVDPASAVKGKVNVSGIPGDADFAQVSLNVYWLYTIAAGSRNKDRAYDFIRFAINAENDAQLTLEGGIGCRLSTWADATINRIVPYYHRLEGLHRHARTLPQHPAWPAIASVIDQAVRTAVETDVPIREILIEAQQKIQAIR